MLGGNISPNYSLTDTKVCKVLKIKTINKNKMKQLSEKAKEKLKGDKIKMEICLELEISYLTFGKWMKNGSKNFNRKDVTELLVTKLGLKKEELFN